MEVRTRFAPSPTGYLHIGGVRTALFNWLFSRRHGGKFLLRIDDTDQQRNIDAALQPILNGFRWLGIEWDEGPQVGGECGPYFQSQRQQLYQDAVRKLLTAGHAYRDYATPEETQAERQVAEQEKRPFRYSRRWMAETDEQAARFEAEGRQAVVRLKMPREGVCEIDDLVRGKVQFEWSAEQDHVVQRNDGSCLYHLATVVDDHLMRISHVIRAEEHLSNTPRQIFIGQALGYALPHFAHLPYVAEPGSKNKLSKRKIAKYLKNQDFKKLYDHGRAIADRLGMTVTDESFNPVLVEFYETVGYLPDAINNYLVLLGWSLDDKTEEFSREQMVEHFSLERINKAPASFDPQKLAAFQARYMQRLAIEKKVELVLPFLERAGLIGSDSDQPRDRVRKIVEAAGDRIKVAGDILDFDDFFVADDALVYDEKAFDKRIRNAPAAKTLLAAYRRELATIEPFEPAVLEQLLAQVVAGNNAAPGDLVHALRVAVTGKAVGFGLFETLALLGRSACKARIDAATAKLT